MVMDQRRELMVLASQTGANRRELAKRYGISPKMLYKWLGQNDGQGPDDLVDQSRRPELSPAKTDEEAANRCAARRESLLLRSQTGAIPAQRGRGLSASAQHRPRDPAPPGSTDEGMATAQAPFRRFEHAQPDDLWHLDVKGHVPNRHRRCHPLTVLDDHSRFSLCLGRAAMSQAKRSSHS